MNLRRELVKQKKGDRCRDLNLETIFSGKGGRSSNNSCIGEASRRDSMRINEWERKNERMRLNDE